MREEFNRAEALRERQARRHRRLRAHHPAAAARLVARGDLPVAAPPPRAAREAGCASWSCSSAAARSTPVVAAARPALDAEDVEDLEDAPDNEVEAAEEEILDQATAARTIAELKIEIETLKRLEALALGVRRSGTGHEVARAGEPARRDLHAGAARERPADGAAAADGAGTIPPPTPSPHQKLVIFTEHRDTLNYLESRITTLLGRTEAVVMIHGGMGREERLKAQESFRHDPEVQVLLATDAAGEGINLQRAHLMVNYDLPWNPNRLEQRFGRIHRIGQTEVCHLWNLVAEETREGDVYRKLLEKLEEARKALGGQVFDVLGKLQFEGRPLRDLLIEAIRYGDQPEVRARLTHGASSNALDREPAAGPARRARARPRRHGRQPRASHPRGHGARRGAPPAAALHRVVLPRSVPAPRRHRPSSASRAATRSPTSRRRCATATA